MDIRGLISRVFPRNMTQYQGAVVVSDSDSIRNDRTYQNYPEILESWNCVKSAYNYIQINSWPASHSSTFHPGKEPRQAAESNLFLQR